MTKPKPKNDSKKTKLVRDPFALDVEPKASVEPKKRTKKTALGTIASVALDVPPELLPGAAAERPEDTAPSGARPPKRKRGKTAEPPAAAPTPPAEASADVAATVEPVEPEKPAAADVAPTVDAAAAAAGSALNRRTLTAIFRSLDRETREHAAKELGVDLTHHIGALARSRVLAEQALVTGRVPSQIARHVAALAETKGDTRAALRAARGPKKPSVRSVLCEMLQRPEGCTTGEVLAEAKRRGLDLGAYERVPANVGAVVSDLKRLLGWTITTSGKPARWHGTAPKSTSEEKAA